MSQIRRIATIFCLILLTATLVASTSSPNLVSVLPVIELLLIVLTVIGIFRSPEAVFRNLDVALGSATLRAPPLE